MDAGREETQRETGWHIGWRGEREIRINKVQEDEKQTGTRQRERGERRQRNRQGKTGEEKLHSVSKQITARRKNTGNNTANWTPSKPLLSPSTVVLTFATASKSSTTFYFKSRSCSVWQMWFFFFHSHYILQISVHGCCMHRLWIKDEMQSAWVLTPPPLAA